MSRGAGSSSRCGGAGGGAGGRGRDGRSDGFARAVFAAGAVRPFVALRVAADVAATDFAAARRSDAALFAALALAAGLAGFFAAAFPLCDLPFVFATRAP